MKLRRTKMVPIFRATLYIAVTNTVYNCSVLAVEFDLTRRSETTVTMTAMSLFAVAPELENMEKSVSVLEGQTLRIPCQATGRPNPVITWTASHREKPTDTDHLQPVNTNTATYAFRRNQFVSNQIKSNLFAIKYTV